MRKSRNGAVLGSLLMVLALVLAACGTEATAVPPTNTAAPVAPTNTTAAMAAPTNTTEAMAAPTNTTEAMAAPTNTAAGNGGTTGGEVKVGVAFALSGAAAIYGTSQKAAVEMAFEEINAAGGPKLVAVYEDTAGKPDQAKSVFQKLINSDKVHVIMGPTLSNEALTADQDAQAAGVPVLGVSNTAAGVTDIGDYIFRDSLTEGVVVPETVKQATEVYKLKNVALLYGNDDAFTKSGADAFRSALQANNVTIVQEEVFANKDTDFKVQLTKLNSLSPKPEAIIMSAVGTAPALLLQQARTDVGIPADVKIIGGNGFNSPAVLASAGAAAEGLVVGAAWNMGNPSELSQKFLAAYKAKTGKDPDQFAAQAYAGAYIVAAAVKQAALSGDLAKDRTAIRDGLKATKDVPTVLGPFNFTDKRDANHPPVVQVVKGGKFDLLK
jgi:branched-chain amino acid transport system substrate-binding protein